MRRQSPEPMLFLPLAIIVSAAAWAQAKPSTTAAVWTTHADPSGFVIDLPSGWTLARDTKSGRITVRGVGGEQAVIWPMSIEQRQLDARGAAALVQQLARKVDDQMPWQSGDASVGAVRAFARGAQRSGIAMMTWSAAANGTTVVLYCVEAPTGVFRSSGDTFARILKSFHVPQDRAAKGNAAAVAAPAGPLSFVDWTDPREKAFTISVPRGWQVVGGAYRLSATDVRIGVTMMSPDDQIRGILGDANLGSFTEPNQVLAFEGLREGGYQTLGDGTRLEIRRYLSGQQFAQAYARTFVQRQCSGLQIVSNNPRPDFVSSLLPATRNDGFTNPQLTGGEATFTCTLNNTPVRGSVVAATVLPFPGRSSLWFVYRLYGYLASPARQQDADKAVQEGMRSFHINAAWQAQQQQIANNAVLQDKLRSQQFQMQAQQAMQEDERRTSDMIVKGYQQRSQVYDEISRRRENAILGTVDVIDPVSGQQYKIDNYSDYHWMNNSGVIAGNNTGDAPGPDWHEMVTLP